MISYQPKHKLDESKQLAADVEKFLAAGNQIKELPSYGVRGAPLKYGLVTPRARWGDQ